MNNTHSLDATRPQEVIAINAAKQPIQMIFRQQGDQAPPVVDITPNLTRLMEQKEFFMVHELQVCCIGDIVPLSNKCVCL
jgi:hypothetical protein